MTYSIVARDPETRELGVAVQSKAFAAGSILGWAHPEIGAVATQAWTNRSYGPDGLRLLEQGLPPEDVAKRLTEADPGSSHRQLGIVDAGGRSFNWTGDACIPWAGGRHAENVAAQANICAGPGVVDALLETYLAGGLPFAELMVRCLTEAEAAGGDRRGRQAAALLTVRRGVAGNLGEDPLDLRVDDHPSPIDELARLLALDRLYRDRPSVDDLRPLDEPLAAELRGLLTDLGAAPGQPTARVVPQMTDRPFLATLGISVIGEPRAYPSGWDDDWQGALEAWIGVENLVERLAAPGWIDSRVVDFLRARSTGAVFEPASGR